MKQLLNVCVCLTIIVAVSHAMTTVPSVQTRLAGGTQYAGRVEVWHNGVWGTVCDDEFGDVDASVVCYSLGYGYVGRALASAYYGPGTGQIWLDSVACTGTETFIGDCSHGGWGMHNCQHTEDVSVDCGEGATMGPTQFPTEEAPQTTAEQRTTTTVAPGSTTTPPAVLTRLVNGTAWAGRVEVWHDGEWGTVCDDGFADVDASVACYSLGYGYVGRAIPQAYYGAGTGRIWLDSVTCFGNETFIGDCLHTGWGNSNCEHSEDVSVDCSAGATTAPASPPTTTTQLPMPSIPSPFTELSHEAEMVALDMSMTPSCLNQYSNQFKLTLDGQLEKAKQAILSSSDFCPGAHDVTLKQNSVNMMAMNANVYLNFDVDVLTQGTETLDSITYCTLQLGDYMADFNNWKQPIWIDISGCPRLEFTSGQFNVTSVAWKCP